MRDYTGEVTLKWTSPEGEHFHEKATFVSLEGEAELIAQYLVQRIKNYYKMKQETEGSEVSS